MAKTSTELPREVQGHLHDIADKLGEQVARGEVVEVVYAKQNGLDDVYEECLCRRYSAKKDGFIHFWSETDPECRYDHLAPNPPPFKIPVLK